MLITFVWCRSDLETTFNRFSSKTSQQLSQCEMTSLQLVSLWWEKNHSQLLEFLYKLIDILLNSLEKGLFYHFRAYDEYYAFDLLFNSVILYI